MSTTDKTSIRKINGIEHTCTQTYGKWYPMDWAEIMEACRTFMPHAHRRFCVGHLNGEEGQYFIDVLTKMADVWKSAPATYQNRKGEDSVAFMHYFGGRIDFYMIEKDREVEQVQAYGYLNYGQGSEAGFVNLEALKRQPIINVDFRYMPETIATLRKAGKIHEIR